MRVLRAALGLVVRMLLRIPIPSWGVGRPRHRMRLIAVVPIRDEMPVLPAFLRNVGPHIDGMVVYDDASSDGSGEWLAARPEVLDVITAPPDRTHWDPRPVMRALIGAARRHRATWILYVIADARLERDFRARAERVVARGRWLGFSAYTVRLRELWGSPDRYRSDGIWGQKRRAWLFRAMADHEFDERELHTIKAPLQAQICGSYPRSDLLAYHLGQMQPEDREARRRKYERLDPEAEWQPELGYGYLTDERGLKLKRVRTTRAYVE